MPANIYSFRGLFHELENYDGVSAYTDVLLPWTSRAQEAMSVLGQYGDAATRLWDKEAPDPCNGGG